MKEEPVRSQNWSKGEFKVPSIYFQRGISSQQIRETDGFSCGSGASSGGAESTCREPAVRVDGAVNVLRGAPRSIKGKLFVLLCLCLEAAVIGNRD